MASPVIHFEILTKDPAALSAFYREAFDWQIEPFGAGATGVPEYHIAKPTHQDDPDRGINGGIGALPPNGYEGHVTFYLYVDDVEAALQKIEKLGGTRMMGPESVPGASMTLGLFKDPQGHTIGLVHPEM